MLAVINLSCILIGILFLIGLIDLSCDSINKHRHRGRPYVYSTTIILRCIIVHTWFSLDSNKTLHHYLSTDLPYNRRVMKACGLSESYLPSRRIFDRRLKTISIDIKERITTMRNLFVSEDMVKPYIFGVDSTPFSKSTKVNYGTRHT
jgi:hypothetical protein